MVLKLPKSLRKDLKEPLGQLFKSINEIKDPLQKQLDDGKLVIGIGDVTTKKLVELDLIPQIAMVDNKIERRPVQHNLTHTNNIKYVKSPAGVLTDELLTMIDESLENVSSNNPILIVVDGEEDLAVLPYVLNSPLDTMILYGQPKEGIVLVKVDTATVNVAKNYYNQLIKE